MNSEALGGLSMGEVKRVLTEVAWREVRGGKYGGRRRRGTLYKLDLIGRLMEKECEGRGMMVKGKMRRRRLVKLRGNNCQNFCNMFLAHFDRKEGQYWTMPKQAGVGLAVGAGVTVTAVFGVLAYSFFSARDTRKRKKDEDKLSRKHKCTDTVI